MTDLFGDSNTSPDCAGSILRRSTTNAAHGFVEFWTEWPAGTRKVAKKQCLDKWARFECGQHATHIVEHVRWLKTQDAWLRENGRFIELPMTYLNQRRWLDWEPPAPRQYAPDALAVIKAHKGVAPPASLRERFAALLGRAVK